MNRITVATVTAVGLIFGAAAAAPALAEAAGSSPVKAESVAAAKYPSEWSSPNGDWVISSKFSGKDTTLTMGTWSHRGTIRVFVTDPTGKRTSHDFRLTDSAAEGWYQFSGSWRAHYPYAGPGQYKVVFAMKSSTGWVNICDKTLGFVAR